VLIQSRSIPDWARVGIKGWMSEDPDPAVDLHTRLGLDSLQAGCRFRFRLRANPCVTRNGKRLGLLRLPEQETWIERKGRDQHGFRLPIQESFGPTGETINRTVVQVSQEQMLRGRRRSEPGQEIRVFSLLYDGILEVTDPGKFLLALRSGVGHGKTMGLGLLSVVPKA
jgi:CRISPR system Cascade subunit CasE